MPEKTQQQTIICQGGLDNSENHLLLSDGQEGKAARLVNYEIGEFGGYRRIEGFSLINNNETNSTVNGSSGTGGVLGVFIYRDLYGLADRLIAARRVLGKPYYSFYEYRANNTWLNISDSVTLNGVTGQNYRPTVMGGNEATADVNNGSPSSSTTVLLDGNVGTIAVGMTLNAIDSSGNFVSELVTAVASQNSITIANAKTLADDAPVTFNYVAVKKLHINKFNDGGGNKVCICDGINAAVVFEETSTGSTYNTITPSSNVYDPSGNIYTDVSGGITVVDADTFTYRLRTTTQGIPVLSNATESYTVDSGSLVYKPNGTDTVAISSISLGTGNVVTVNTSGSHGLSSSNLVGIVGVKFTNFNPNRFHVTTTFNANDPGGAFALFRPACSAFAFNTLFTAGDGTSVAPTSIIAHGLTNGDGTANVIDFASTGGGQVPADIDVIQMKAFRDDLFIFGRTGIKKVSTSGTNFVIENVTKNLGCISADSVVEVAGDLIFLSQDGFRPVAGTARIGDIELETISKAIQSDVVRLGDLYDLDRTVAVVVPSKSQVRYFLNASDPTTIAVADAPGFIGGLRLEDNRIDWEWGKLQGIQANCADSAFLNSVEYVVHGDHSGRVFRQESGTTFNTENIVAIYETPYIDMGDPLIRKTIRKVDAFIRAEGAVTLGLSLDFDYGDPDLFRPADLSEVTEGAITEFDRSNVTYVNDVTDSSVFLYGGQTKPLLSYHIQGSGHSVQFRFISNGDFSPYSIQGLILKFTTSGKQ